MLILLFGFTVTHSQTYTVNQQSQQVNINVPVIEKPVYIERYRTVYVDKPRKARKLSEPVLLLGYLWVYPEDLGTFKQIPTSVIKSVNSRRPYGKNNWRIPTPDELAVLEANAERIGLGDDIYLATDHRNGTLRLVSIEGEYEDCVKVGRTYWMKRNLGANSSGEAGSDVSYEDAVRFCPAGYRLPTKAEFEELLASGMANFDEASHNYGAELFFPARKVGRQFFYETYRVAGEYWIKGRKTLYWHHYCDADKWFTQKPEIQNTSVYATCMVRYVLDK